MAAPGRAEWCELGAGPADRGQRSAAAGRRVEPCRATEPDPSRQGCTIATTLGLKGCSSGRGARPTGELAATAPAQAGGVVVSVASGNGAIGQPGGSPPGTACSRIACSTDSHHATRAFVSLSANGRSMRHFKPSPRPAGWNSPVCSASFRSCSTASTGAAVFFWMPARSARPYRVSPAGTRSR